MKNDSVTLNFCKVKEYTSFFPLHSKLLQFSVDLRQK